MQVYTTQTQWYKTQLSSSSMLFPFQIHSLIINPNSITRSCYVRTSAWFEQQERGQCWYVVSTMSLTTRNSSLTYRSAWTLFTAATATDSSVRDALISSVWAHAITDKGPFSISYKVDSTDSVPNNGAARYVVACSWVPSLADGM